MAPRINVHTVQQLAQDFTRLASVVQALSFADAAPSLMETYRKDMDDALSDLVDAMGYELALVSPARLRASRPIGESAI